MQEQLKYYINHSRFKQKPTANLASFSQAELHKAWQFHRSIPEYAPTPLYHLPALAKSLNVGQIYLKDESQRFGLKAFKALGGAYAMACHIAEELGKDISELPYNVMVSNEVREQLNGITFATTTDGNHGRGVAWMARQLKQKSVVYMPKGSSHERLDAILNEGATAEIVDMNYDDAVRMTAEMARKYGWVVVQDTAWAGYEKIPQWIMQGYSTLMFEALSQLHEVKPTHVFVQAGVGSFAGMVQGMLTALYGEDRPKVIIAEAQIADCLYRSAVAENEEATSVGGDLQTVMAGLACGEANIAGWQLLRDYADAFFSCPDFVATRGMRILGNPLPTDPPIVSGESGAVTTGLLSILMQSQNYADVRNRLELNENSRILLISTEGDTDIQRYRDIVWDGEFPSFGQF
ncbi:diaminopropionate ammonia-lyase [Providencia rettgeri]|uniref:Diaminopropionate ammonia-lyase n=1 Tax=Providencia rettgeri TaxID=587 RepID=A0AAW6UCZ8_PRORE|nr:MULTISPECIES: diaminopropionate ammonia-lyase [Providencia]MBG5892983.1 diaminopropionate ammonia-lyase [Providencia rettgeri]MBQ0531068.1 diaminopropionate ammonia-lyase [Providencia rettgeri]MDI9093049.1 diaminopropionate ammonia-lyase [Providencia rettgeri]MDT2036136.1 diaminopropionate ammonia-lyase [Providencia rettgeri]WOB85757.1 diaminopropionate ammonia-lyase [Providencia sp. PROV040]